MRTARRSVKRSRSDDLHFQRLRTHAWRLGSRPSAKQVLPSWLSDGALRRRRARPVGEPEFRPRTISFALPGKRGALSWSRGKEEEEGRVVVPLRVGVVLFVSLVANHAASAHLAAGPGDAHAFGRQPEKKNKTARYKVATWTASKAHTSTRQTIRRRIRGGERPGGGGGGRRPRPADNFCCGRRRFEPEGGAVPHRPPRTSMAVALSKVAPTPMCREKTRSTVKKNPDLTLSNGKKQQTILSHHVEKRTSVVFNVGLFDSFMICCFANRLSFSSTRGRC